MPLPTPQEFLAKLEASPADAAAFDKLAGGKTRREAVEDTLAAVSATITAAAALKAQVAASKAKIAALETARKSQPASFMKTPPSLPVKATPQVTATAASFATQPLIMARAEFDKLTPADKSRFFKTGGKLV
jgi:hypothetical protein